MRWVPEKYKKKKENKKRGQAMNERV